MDFGICFADNRRNHLKNVLKGTEFKVELKYGHRQHSLQIPDRSKVSILRPTVIPTLVDVEAELENEGAAGNSAWPFCVVR
jgi:hypothetical protein